RMTNQEFRTLAYAKSPKTSRRTTFQDELQAAVSARAIKTKTDHYSYSDDFDEDEDGEMADHLFSELLKSRRKRTDAFKSGKSKAKINNFELSDDEGKHGKTKRVSFLKTQRISFPSGDTSESRENEPPDSSLGGHNNNNNSFSSPHTTSFSKYDSQYRNGVDPQIPRESSSKSLSYQTSDDTLLDMPLPLPSDSSVVETPGPEENAMPVNTQCRCYMCISTNRFYSDIATEREPPKPKPRQRTLVLSSQVAQKLPEEMESQDLSRPQTSSASIPLSTDASSNTAVRSCSPHVGFSFFHSKTTPRCQSACSRKVESKYLGTLKVLDRKVSLQESQPQAADSLRAAIYQVSVNPVLSLLVICWIPHHLPNNKQEEEAKKEDAVASYVAWKEKKAESLKAKAKEKQDRMRKDQRVSEEKEEKRHSAKQVFEKWKQEHDHLLKEKYRKQKEAENKLQLNKQKKKEERKRESMSAFSNWCEKKKDVLQEKVTTERKEFQNKAEEEQYMKEERDKMALEMYENWLARKELEQKRQREERRIQAILRDSPPPPWSPPNKTIAFRK
uniref:Microtubule-associated protein 9 n=1 Tax=Scophthalmus maximus TaxID=52904 RepID=A0A8D3AF04_SCOMX